MWIGSDDEDQSGEEQSKQSQPLSPGMEEFFGEMKRRRNKFEKDYKKEVNSFADDEEIDSAWKVYMAKQQGPPPRPPPRPSAPTRSDKSAYQQRMNSAFSRLDDPQKPPRKRGGGAPRRKQRALVAAKNSTTLQIRPVIRFKGLREVKGCVCRILDIETPRISTTGQLTVPVPLQGTIEFEDGSSFRGSTFFRLTAFRVGLTVEQLGLQGGENTAKNWMVVQKADEQFLGAFYSMFDGTADDSELTKMLRHTCERLAPSMDEDYFEDAGVKVESVIMAKTLSAGMKAARGDGTPPGGCRIGRLQLQTKVSNLVADAVRSGCLEVLVVVNLGVQAVLPLLHEDDLVDFGDYLPPDGAKSVVIVPLDDVVTLESAGSRPHLYSKRKKPPNNDDEQSVTSADAAKSLTGSVGGPPTYRRGPDGEEDWSYDDDGRPQIPIKAEPPVQPSRLRQAEKEHSALQDKLRESAANLDSLRRASEAQNDVPPLLSREYSKVADALSIDLEADGYDHADDARLVATYAARLGDRGIGRDDLARAYQKYTSHQLDIDALDFDAFKVPGEQYAQEALAKLKSGSKKRDVHLVRALVMNHDLHYQTGMGEDEALDAVAELRTSEYAVAHAVAEAYVSREPAFVNRPAKKQRSPSPDLDA